MIKKKYNYQEIPSSQEIKSKKEKSRKVQGFFWTFSLFCIVVGCIFLAHYTFFLLPARVQRMHDPSAKVRYPVLMKRGRRYGDTPDDNDEDTCVIPKNVTDKCAYVKESCSEFGADCIFKWLHWYHCGMHKVHPLFFILLVLTLAYLFIILSSTADANFVPSLLFLSDRLKLSEEIAGITLLSFGNGAPDLFSQLAGSSNGTLSVSLGESMGSGLFTVTLLVAIIALIKPIHMKWRALFKDGPTYLLANVLLLVVMLVKGMSFGMMLVFYLLYIAYVVLSVILERVMLRYQHFHTVQGVGEQELQTDKQESSALLKNKEGEATYNGVSFDEPGVQQVQSLNGDSELHVLNDPALSADKSINSDEEEKKEEKKDDNDEEEEIVLQRPITPQSILTYCLAVAKAWTEWDERNVVS